MEGRLVNRLILGQYGKNDIFFIFFQNENRKKKVLFSKAT